ncbi:MAG: ankyrin repeat domain-containing protein [Alphaproteobacteria bacterium]|nr:MAG: ankyrin repeat domain-containing protein [Alphaproteobacteria bacterium]
MIPPYDTPQHQLFFHAEDGDFNALKQLIKGGGLNINGQDDYGWTALSLAAMGGKTDCVKLLLENGADPSLAYEANGWTPLIYAAYANDSEAMAALIKKGANIHATDTEEGRNALMWCAYWGFRDGIETLMAAGAHTNDRDNQGQSAEDIAVKYKRTEILDSLESHVERKNKQSRNLRCYLKNKHFKR